MPSLVDKVGDPAASPAQSLARRDRAVQPGLLTILGIGAGGIPLALGFASSPAAAHTRDPIVYRFVSPEDPWTMKASAIFRTYQDEEHNTIFEFRKPSSVAGNRNYVAEVRPDDATYVQIRTQKDKVLFEEQSSAWSTRSTATEDRYYIMNIDTPRDGKKVGQDPYKFYPNDSYDFSYWLVLVGDDSVRRFTCVFDNSRLTAPRDRKIMKAMNDDLGSGAQQAIARFLSEHGAKVQTENCRPYISEADSRTG